MRWKGAQVTQKRHEWLVICDFSGLTGRGSNSSNALVPIAAAGAGSGVNIASTTSVDRRLETLGTVRGRIGFTPFDQLLIFGSGGYAFGAAKSSTTITQSCTSGATACTITFLGPATGSGSQNLSGWTAGGGIEYAVARSWSVKVEYLHYDLGSMTYASTPLANLDSPGGAPFTTINVSSMANFKGDLVRVGLNYQFH
jgi:outer membrane immunogenic protein